MKEIVERGATSQITHVFIADSTSAVGAGKTAMNFVTPGLKIVVIRPGDPAPTKYLQSAGNIENITTLGTYQTPTANRCRFKEIDATDMPGVYEIHFPNSLFDNTGARRSITGLISGATGMAPTPFAIQLSDPAKGVGSPTAISTLTQAEVAVVVDAALTDSLQGINDVIAKIDTTLVQSGAVWQFTEDALELGPQGEGGGGGGSNPEIEQGILMTDAISYLFASAAGHLSGGGTGEIVIRAGGQGPSGPVRIVAHTNVRGDRIGVDLFPREP